MGSRQPARRQAAPALRRPRAGRAGVHEPLRLGGQRGRRVRGTRLHGVGRERGCRPPLRSHRVGPVPPLRPPVPPRGGRHRPRPRDDRQLRPRHLRLQAVVDDGAVPRGASGARAGAGGRRVGLPARLRWRRFDRRREAVRPGDRPGSPAPAARGQRPDAEGREPEGARDAPPPRRRRAPPFRRCQRRVPGGAARRHRARAEAADHRRHLRRGVRARGAPAGHRGPPARAGHDLSGHDRDGRHQAFGDHQDAPQPRPRDRADDRRGPRRRAARGTLQGRGARTRRTARHPARDDLAAPVPRARPRRPAPVLEGRRRSRGLRRDRAAGRRCGRPLWVVHAAPADSLGRRQGGPAVCTSTR